MLFKRYFDDGKITSLGGKMDRTVAIFFAIIALTSADFFGDPDSVQISVFSEEEPGARLISISKREATDDLTCTEAFSCIDCKTAHVCRPNADGHWSTVRTTTCDAYCDHRSGTCTTKPDPVCGEADDFTCMKKNDRFPSATNLTTYHVCTDFVAKQFECVLDGHGYNPTTQKCEDGFKSELFECKGKGLKVPHPSDHQYFAYCSEDNNVLVIDKCPNHYRLNETSQNCEPHCIEEGVFAHPSDCTKYIKCSSLWVGGNHFLDPVTMKCADNTGYDSSQFMCVSLESMPHCGPRPYTTITPLLE